MDNFKDNLVAKLIEGTATEDEKERLRNILRSELDESIKKWFAKHPSAMGNNDPSLRKQTAAVVFRDLFDTRTSLPKAHQ